MVTVRLSSKFRKMLATIWGTSPAIIVKSGEFDQSRLVGDISLHLHGVGQAVDVLVVTPEQVERYQHAHCLIIAPALREGREVYRDGTLCS
jgi:hypothetical protein